MQHISVDSAVLPDGFDLNATEFDLMPGYKSGYHIKVGGDKKASFSAILLDKNGQPLIMEGGQLVLQDSSATNNKPILFFTNNKGHMSVNGIDNGQYLIELFSGKHISTTTTNSIVSIKNNKNIINIKGINHD